LNNISIYLLSIFIFFNLSFTYPYPELVFFSDNVFYIEVDNISNIKLLKDKKQLFLAESLKATKTILKRVNTDAYINKQLTSKFFKQ